ncbi:MAG: rhodanese-like domain-containing protein [Candidatus Saliniplasma sp.]
MYDKISAEELKKKMERGDEIQVIHVLSEKSYKDRHLPGAVNIPYRDIAKRKDEIDPDKEIIVYCDDKDCDASPIAAEKLVKLGFEDVTDFEGGLLGWEQAGYEFE